MQTAPGVSPERIFSMMQAYQQTAALDAAIELDLFTAIAAGTSSVDELAGQCGASPKGMRVLCDFLTINGLLTKSPENQYGLAPDAAFFLDRNSPAYIGRAAKFLNSPTFLHEMDHATASVRKGGTALPNHGTMAPDHPLWVEFAHGMMNMMMPASQTIAGVAGTGPLKVLDIAAGHGLFGIMIAKNNPEAEIHASDWADVLAVAKEHAAQFGVADRYHLVPGSAFEVDLGSGFDVVLLTNFLHHFDPSTCETLLRRVHASLKQGGRVITLEFCPNDDRVTPPGSAVFAYTMLLSTDAGDAYTVRELATMFTNAGFGSTEAMPVPGMPQTVLISQR